MIYSICKKCQWYQIWKGTVTHNIDTRICIHPILDKTGDVDIIRGRNKLRIVKCSYRNSNLNCKYFQPSLGFWGLVIALLKGRTLMSQVYEDYQAKITPQKRLE